MTSEIGELAQLVEHLTPFIWGAASNGTGTALQAVISRFESEALHKRTKIIKKISLFLFVF